MMAVNVYHACIVGIFTTRLRHLFVCGPRRAKNNSFCAAFRCAMARERDRAPQIRTTDFTTSCQNKFVCYGSWFDLRIAGPESRIGSDRPIPGNPQP